MIGMIQSHTLDRRRNLLNVCLASLLVEQIVEPKELPLEKMKGLFVMPVFHQEEAGMVRNWRSTLLLIPFLAC